MKAHTFFQKILWVIVSAFWIFACGIIIIAHFVFRIKIKRQFDFLIAPCLFFGKLGNL